MTTTVYITRPFSSHSFGDVITVDKDRAARLVRYGYAEYASAADADGISQGDVAALGAGSTVGGTAIAVSPASTDDVYYVSGAGDDTADGLTPGSAFATVAQALSVLGTGSGTIFLSHSTHLLPAGGIVIGGRIRIMGYGPDTCILRYEGNATAITMNGRMPSLQGVKVLTTNADPGVVGVRINAPTSDTYYQKIKDVTISATTKIAGQVGLQLQNTATTAIFWGQHDDVLIENFGTSIHFDNDVTNGINANRFVGVKLHNADTCIDFEDAAGNNFFALIADTFTLGITGSGNRNHIYGRLEGGTGSQSYQLLAGAQENVLVIDDNCPVASTDAGTANLITALSSGKRKAWHNDPAGRGFPYTVDNPMRGGAVGIGVANRALYMRAKGGGTISKVRLAIGTQSGNICVAICRGALGRNGPTERLATTGSIACPASGEVEVDLDVPVTMDSNCWFALAADNTTATFDVKATASTVSAKGYALGHSAFQDTAFPVPSVPSTSPATVPEFILTGVV